MLNLMLLTNLEHGRNNFWTYIFNNTTIYWESRSYTTTLDTKLAHKYHRRQV
jgi:hypothetical protein